MFTAGGFNPLFAPPPDLTSSRRLSISLSPSPLLNIWADSYFAVTASSLQFGAAMYMEAKLGPIGAKGHVSLDTLIRTEPKLHFIATISGEFQLTVGGEDIATMNVDVLLEGPGHWHARAHASIGLFFFSVSGTLDLEWGTDSILGARVRPSTSRRRCTMRWRRMQPGRTSSPPRTPARCNCAPGRRCPASARPAAPDPDGGAARRAAREVRRKRGHLGGSGDGRDHRDAAASWTTAQELFATSQFFELSDEDRLSKPAFLPFDAGGTLQGEAWQVSDPQTAAVVYEESLGDDDGSAGPSNFRALDAVALGWVRPRRRRPRPSLAREAARGEDRREVPELLGRGRRDRRDRLHRRGVGDDRRRRGDPADTIAVADFELRKVS